MINKMVSKIKKLFWKTQDIITSLSVRCELDFIFNLIQTILLIIILILLLKK